MKKILSKLSFTRLLVLLSLTTLSVTFNSCVDDFYQTHKPSWLGESLYVQLQTGYKDNDGVMHTFNNYKRLVDDIGYAEVLKLTGSKTIFAADDAAFARFFKSNPWGVRSYEGFTLPQKKLLMNSSMINNAYLIELMSGTPGSSNGEPNFGQAMRRSTAVSVLDSVTFEPTQNLPPTSYWDERRATGYYLFKDNSAIPMVHFLQRQMDFKGITNQDFEFIMGVARQKNDAYIYGNKVIVQDITCKNGYLNIMKDVLVPPSNMAEMIRTNPKTTLFSAMLERFSAPYFDQAMTDRYLALHPEMAGQKLYIKRYFSARTGAGEINQTPDKKPVKGSLAFDPGWNMYFPASTSGSYQTDMGAMIVPSNDEINKFFSVGGAGEFLIEKYGSLENIPLDRLAPFINNLMLPSFLGSVPHVFDKILDDGQVEMGFKPEHVDTTLVANNGVVYVSNVVFAPAMYSAVTAPLLVNDNLRIFQYAIDTYNFKYYLLSMDSRYSFLVPTDETPLPNGAVTPGLYYVDPVSLKKNPNRIFRFSYGVKNGKNTVLGVSYAYDPLTATVTVGPDSVVLTDDQVKNRLLDMLDSHIVVGDIEDGSSYYRTKGNAEIRVVGKGVGAQIYGGGNLEKNTPATVTKWYDMTKETNKGRGNGKTYLVDAPIMPSTRSVYNILSEEPEFSEFFKLLEGNPMATPEEKNKFAIFTIEKKAGLDYNVRFFNTYHYTVYAPTNAAILDAISQGLPTWDIINAQTNQDVRDSLSAKLVNFLRYHFQDNSIYIDGKNTFTDEAYETSAIFETKQGDETIKSYYKLYTHLDVDGLKVASNIADLYNGNAANVTKVPGQNNSKLYNLMARDYVFNSNDLTKVSMIETSSYAVIHQIDKVLLYDANQLAKMKRLVKGSFRVQSSVNKKVKINK